MWHPNIWMKCKQNKQMFLLHYSKCLGRALSFGVQDSTGGSGEARHTWKQGAGETGHGSWHLCGRIQIWELGASWGVGGEMSVQISGGRVAAKSLFNSIVAKASTFHTTASKRRDCPKETRSGLLKPPAEPQGRIHKGDWPLGTESNLGHRKRPQIPFPAPTSI